MKTENAFANTRICIVLFILFFSYMHQVKAQSIITGDTMSQGVVYMDIDDLMVSASFPSGSDSESLDINEDGTMDLKFTASAMATMGSSLESSRIVTLAYAETVFYQPQSSWVDELPAGVTIDENSPWASGGTLKSESSFPDTSYSNGIFNYGYAGFRIPSQEGYLYGWVHLSAGNSHVFIHEYAYQSMNTSLNEMMEDYSVNIFPNPAVNFLSVALPAGHEYRKYIIIDVLGNILLSESLYQHQKQLKINTSALSDGLYTLVIEGKGIVARQFIKQSE
jgi:hypothetical protein